METRKSVSLASLALAAAAVTDSSEGVTKVPAAFLSLRRRAAVGDGVDQLNVADGSLDLLHLLGHALVALAAQARPAS